MGLAPNPGFPERTPTVYERKFTPALPGNRGPLRFEEGLATDTDLPNGFQRGMQEMLTPAPGRPNHVDPETQFKRAEETMGERAHVGSAAWVEAPIYLAEFAHGSFSDYAEVSYEQVNRSGSSQYRANPATVLD